MCTFVAEGHSNGQAYAARGTGNEGNLSLEALRWSASQGRTSYRVTANFSNGMLTLTRVPEWFESTFKLPPN